MALSMLAARHKSLNRCRHEWATNPGRIGDTLGPYPASVCLGVGATPLAETVGLQVREEWTGGQGMDVFKELFGQGMGMERHLTGRTGVLQGFAGGRSR